MACKDSCRLCQRLVISTAVAFTDGNLVITIPEGSYNNKQKYCIVVAQAIPDTVTINAPVVVQIGTGTVQYPLTNCNGTPVLARALRTRTRYATVVNTTADSGVFRLLQNLCCSNIDSLSAIDGTDAADAGTTPGA